MVIVILFLVAWCDVKLDNDFCSLLDYEKGYNSCFLRIWKVHEMCAFATNPWGDISTRRFVGPMGQPCKLCSLSHECKYAAGTYMEAQRNRYAEHMYGYSASEAIGQDAIELIVHPTDFDAAKVVIQNIFMGKCFRGKFPVKNKSGERFFIVVHNTPLYDDDGSLIGLICVSLDVRTLQEIFSPSTTEKSCQSSSKPHFHDNNRPKSGSQNKGSSDSQQPLQSASTSKITTFATKLTSRVRSRIRTGQNCERQCASGCEEQYSEHDVRANLTTSEASTPNEDVRFGVFAAEEKSPRELSKTSTDNPGEGKVGFHKKISSKAEALLAKKGISWPRKGRENDGGSGKSNITSTHLHDKQENDQSHQRVPVVEPIMIPDCQDTEYAQSSKYEFSGSWWTFNNTSSMNSTSTIGSPIERVDYEADCLDYEILWEDLIIGEQVGQVVLVS
ncbi:hypothetical protein TRIUR3_08829 [Triticum urartu]|uniref:PAS domain-containing protein n=1 Tax=Triticum urartu TaxID=4572 RepID=M7ZBE0_TRIUA|nr:hypothetical protein TRIUR3_08829 [Triticum urartu]